MSVDESPPRPPRPLPDVAPPGGLGSGTENGATYERLRPVAEVVRSAVAAAERLWGTELTDLDMTVQAIETSHALQRAAMALDNVLYDGHEQPVNAPLPRDGGRPGRPVEPLATSARSGPGPEASTHPADPPESASRDPFSIMQGVADYAIGLLDANGHLQSWNMGGERITGHAASQAIGQHISIIYTDEQVEAGAPGEALQLAAANGCHAEDGWRQRRDGSSFWAATSLTPVWDERSGQLGGFVALIRDDTERLRLATDRVLVEALAAREAIGADLHHEVIQRLFSVGLILAGAHRRAERPALGARLDEAIAELDAVIRHIRTTLWAAATPPENTDEPVPGVDLSILVVEDDPDMQLLLSQALAGLGRVQTSPDTYQALDRLESDDVDVMVLDLLLPGTNGVELLERLRSRGRDVPTVVVSGLASGNPLATMAREAGAAVILTKPFDRYDLRASVAQAARSGAGLDGGRRRVSPD